MKNVDERIFGTEPHDGDRTKCPDGYVIFPSLHEPVEWMADTIPASGGGYIAPDGNVMWHSNTTLHPSEPAAIAACWAHKDRAEGRTPQRTEPAPVDGPDPGVALALRLLSLVRDGYWITPMGDGRYDWSLSENEQHICPDLESAISAAESHRRKQQQQPKPVWYVREHDGMTQDDPFYDEHDARSVAIQRAVDTGRPVQVLGVVQVVQPDQT